MALKLYSMKEILAWTDPPEPGIVDELLYPGQLSLLVGAPKAGKTTLARSLCLAVARGAEWMGRSTITGKVVLVEKEGSPVHERDALVKLGAREEDNIHMVIDTPYEREEFLDELEAMIKKHKPSLVIIDTLFRCLHIEDGNDYGKALNAMDRISGVAKRTKCHCLLIHHARKGGGKSTDNDLSLGSQALTGTSDTNLFLRGKAPNTWLSSEQRYGRAIHPAVKVLMDPAGWTHADLDTKEQGSNRTALIIAALEKHPSKWRTLTALADETGISRDAVEKALRALHKNDRVKYTGSGKKGDPRKVKLS